MRVRRTFAFLDLSGFTSLTATEGDERAVAVVEAFRGALRRTCSRRAVRIAKWLGDGAMLVAVDATPIVSVALEMQYIIRDAIGPVGLRVGVATGPVILLEGDDYIGHAVNLAARLSDIAGSGEILADPVLAEALPPWAAWIDGATVAVRGMDAPVAVVKLCLAEAGPNARPDPVCGIPLTEDCALYTRAAGGAGTWLFCSDSCLDTWQSRPTPGGDEAAEGWVREGIA
ncbi:MAG: adenylate/guanylate cyclase domain-containing protein [Acidimicrobiales bacterium]